MKNIIRRGLCLFMGLLLLALAACTAGAKPEEISPPLLEAASQSGNASPGDEAGKEQGEEPENQRLEVIKNFRYGIDGGLAMAEKGFYTFEIFYPGQTEELIDGELQIIIPEDSLPEAQIYYSDLESGERRAVRNSETGEILSFPLEPQLYGTDHNITIYPFKKVEPSVGWRGNRLYYGGGDEIFSINCESGEFESLWKAQREEKIYAAAMDGQHIYAFKMKHNDWSEIVLCKINLANGAESEIKSLTALCEDGKRPYFYFVGVWESEVLVAVSFAVDGEEDKSVNRFFNLYAIDIISGEARTLAEVEPENANLSTMPHIFASGKYVYWQDYFYRKGSPYPLTPRDDYTILNVLDLETGAVEKYDLFKDNKNLESVLLFDICWQYDDVYVPIQLRYFEEGNMTQSGGETYFRMNLQTGELEEYNAGDLKGRLIIKRLGDDYIIADGKDRIDGIISVEDFNAGIANVRPFFTAGE